MKNLEFDFYYLIRCLLICVIFTFSGVAVADWTLETTTTFKGETNKYLVSKSDDDSEVWIDLQINHIAYSHKKSVIKGVNGVKIDGIFFDNGGASTSDKMDSAAFCGEDYARKCYQSFFNAKTIEVNVEYFGNYSKVSVFHVNASPDTKEKYYIDSFIEKCKQSKTDYYYAAYKGLHNFGFISDFDKLKVNEYCETDDAIKFLHEQDSQLYSNLCGSSLLKISQTPKINSLGEVLGCVLVQQCESLEHKSIIDTIKKTCPKVDWSINPTYKTEFEKYILEKK